MNYWLKLSLEYANQRSYLDDLFRVYPTIPEGIREIDQEVWQKVEEAYEKRDNEALIEALLELDLFPIKDSYVAYLKRDRGAIKRNPKTINRLCGRLYEMGLSEIYMKCSQPKETNRQIGPMFKNWVKKGSLGIKSCSLDAFLDTKEDAILDASDAQMKTFAQQHLSYTLDKGLDFIARVNGQYVIGEAKFLTDFGGHQNAQFNDAIKVFEMENLQAIPIAILDGVLYIKGNHKMYKQLTTQLKEHNIMSALVLREFLYQI